MKKMMKPVLFLAAAFVFLCNPAQAQLAKQNLSMRELTQALSELISKDDEASKAQLLKETKALASAKNESYNTLAARLYRQLGDEKAADKIMNGLAKKYPKGIAARNAEMQKFLNDENSSLEQKTKAYRAWLKKFPASSFDANDRQVYMSVASQLGQQMIQENQVGDAVALARENAGTPEYFGIVYSLASELIRNDRHSEALPLLTEAARALESETGRNRYHASIMGQYGAALIHSGQVADGLAIIESLVEQAGSRVNPNDVLALSQGYATQGRELDAFQVLENYMINNAKHADIAAAMEPLYNKLNNNKGDYKAYAAGLNARIKNALKAKYKTEMVERDAPGFTLTNMQGETVSLDDYRGKIVILDFWATWCGPCIMSFPGMQAAVNKYADDPNVEFLFINTWQSEDNYKELVTNFINENNYTFHVVYDEMKDRDKATVTAYGVRGIPTKVFIDPEGKIRFQSAGGSANVDVVVGEMEAKIELIKEATAAKSSE